MKRFSPEELYAVRNSIPMREVIEVLLEVPSKEVEGVYRFLCPVCREFQTGVHEKTNLGRCFLCQRNFNAIELVMEDRKISFVESVKLLQKCLHSRSGSSGCCSLQKTGLQEAQGATISR